MIYFKIPFVSYLIEINNIVKRGIVGEKEESKDENLDFWLATIVQLTHVLNL